jgi:hypothetical protein
MHGVHHLRVEGNVAYHVMGHTFFLEDGVETKNVIRNNLGVLTLESLSLLATDATPATFWIVNADNIVVGNAAAGSKNYGFWINPEVGLALGSRLVPTGRQRVALIASPHRVASAQPHVTGAAVGTPMAVGVCPQGVAILNFSDNVAHSNGRYKPRSQSNVHVGMRLCMYIRTRLLTAPHQYVADTVYASTRRVAASSQRGCRAAGWARATRTSQAQWSVRVCGATA